MKFRHFSTILILFFLSGFTYAQQCPPGGAIFVNEVFNQGSNEYVELVVVGDPANPTDPVDLTGWILDDNNFPLSGVGTAKGHLIFTSNFSMVNPGTLIVIYNETSPYPGLPASNPPWLYVISCAEMDGCSDSPSIIPPNGGYTPCGTPGGDDDWFQLNNTNDIVQTRFPGAIFYHGVEWGNPTTDVPTIEVPGNTTSLDCGDWFDANNYATLTPSPGQANTPLNQALINDIANGNLDCDNIEASCALFVCPEISDITMPDAICAGKNFSVSASGLTTMGEAANAETDFGIEFVLFNGGLPGDPYSGGTTIATVPYSGLTGVDPNQVATINTSISAPGTYTICAILDPAPIDDNCRPEQCKTIEINANPTASLSGYLLFCPGDCHEIGVSIAGGNEPYEARFIVQIGPINFPFTIPAYDVDNQLTICYDQSGFVPIYDAFSNTLHFPTIITGTANLTLQEITDDADCQPAVIDPNFMELEFIESPDIFGAGPLYECDEDGDGLAVFDLESLDNVVSGGTGNSVFWYEDPAGNFPISDPGNYSTGTTLVYTQVQDMNCASTIIPIELFVELLPDPGTDNAIERCFGDSDPVDLTVLLNGESGGYWSDDDNSGIDLTDPTDVFFTTLDPGIWHYTYTLDGSGYCPPQSASLTITIAEPAIAGEDGLLGICSGSTGLVNLFEHLGGDFSYNGIWSDPQSSGIDLSDPNQVDFSSLAVGNYTYQYTVFSDNACPDALAYVVLEVYDEPDAGIDAVINTCNVGTTRLDLESALGDHDLFGNWSDDDNSGVQLSPPDDVDFAGVTPGTYHFTYTIPETDNCPEVSSTVTIIVSTTLYAGADGSLQLCVGDDTPVDLFEWIDGESDESGFWSKLTGDPIDLTQTDQVDFSSLGPGVDTLLYEIQNGCGTDSAFLFVTLLGGANAGLDYQLTLCQTTDTINLFDSLGFYDTGGYWLDAEMDTLASPASVSFDTAGLFVFQYILPEFGQCAGDTSTAIIDVSAAAFAGRDSSVLICEGSQILQNLFELIPGMLDSAGHWLQVSGSPLDLTDPYLVDLSMAGLGTDSLFYILDGPCYPDTALAIITIDDAPYAGDDYSLRQCEQITFNLFDSLKGYTLGGNWYDQNGMLIQDPDAYNFNLAGQFTFSYIIPQSGTCLPDTALANFIIDAPPDAGENATLYLCAGVSTSINLLDELNGTPDAGGTWSDVHLTGLDVDNPVQLDFSALNSGTYEFIYQVSPSDPQSACSPATSVLSVTIIEAPNPGMANALSLCMDALPVSIDLEALLGTHDLNGHWLDLDNTGIDLSDPQAVNFSNLQPGTYQFTYQIDAGTYCPEASATIAIQILESPYAGTDQLLEVCEGYPEDINLNSLLDPGASGSGNWSDLLNIGIDISDPARVSVANLPFGAYQLFYLVSLNNGCGTDTSMLNINLQRTPVAGSCDTVFICNGPSAGTLNFPDILLGEDPDGFFRELTDSGVDLTDPQQIDFEDVVQGRYIFEYYFPAVGNCPEISSRIYVNVLPSDRLLFEAEICPGEFFEIGQSTYDLDNPEGVEYLSSQNGCDSIITILLTPKVIGVTEAHSDANCFGLGSITLMNLMGGSLPLVAGNDALGLFQVDQLPYVIDQIPEGNYVFDITDSQNCQDMVSVEIAPFEGFDLYLSDEVSLPQGVSFRMDLSTSMDPVEILWSPAEGLDCTDCLQPLARPSADTEYFVTLTDAEGCILNDSILIRVESVVDIYIPNAFSPNGDAFNESFYVQSGGQPGSYTMDIYSRWGELIFHGENLPLDQASDGWDGRYKNKLLDPAIFVYHIRVTFPDGKTQELTGDILLIR